jgi:hypothetical protein
MDWGVAQVVKCLLCKCEALNSNPSPTKKKNPKKRPTKTSQVLWLITVIQATQETRSRGSQFKSSGGGEGGFGETPISTNKLWWHIPVIPAMREEY